MENIALIIITTVKLSFENLTLYRDSLIPTNKAEKWSQIAHYIELC